MISNKAQLSTKTKNSEHIYQCDQGVNLTEVLEALNEFRSYCYGRIKEAEEEQQKASAEAPAEQPQG